MVWHNHDCVYSGVDCPLGCSCARCDNYLTYADVTRAIEHEAWKKQRAPHGEPKEKGMFSGYDCETGCECEGCPYYEPSNRWDNALVQLLGDEKPDSDEGAYDTEMEEVE